MRLDQKSHAEQIAATFFIRISGIWFPPVLYWRNVRMHLQGLVHLAPAVESIAACKLLGELCCNRRSSRVLPIKCRAHWFTMIPSMPARCRLWQRIIIKTINLKVRTLHFFNFLRERASVADLRRKKNCLLRSGSSQGDSLFAQKMRVKHRKAAKLLKGPSKMQST